MFQSAPSRSESGRAVAAAVIPLGQHPNPRVIPEEFKTTEQFAFLREIQCFYFCWPVTLEAIADLRGSKIAAALND